MRLFLTVEAFVKFTRLAPRCCTLRRLALGKAGLIVATTRSDASLTAWECHVRRLSLEFENKEVAGVVELVDDARDDDRPASDNGVVPGFERAIKPSDWLTGRR